LDVKTIAEEEGEYEQEEVGEPDQPKASTRPPEISDELAALGVYARSMKPGKDWLTQERTGGPQHVLINISESALSALLPHRIEALVDHAIASNRRVYPRGTRIESQNMDPSLYWRTGSQIAALNWQTFDHGMQLNEALFVGTHGYILKPYEMRTKAGEESYVEEQQADKTDTTLDIDIAGLSSCESRSFDFLATSLPGDSDTSIRAEGSASLCHGRDLPFHRRPRQVDVEGRVHHLGRRVRRRDAER
jgi:hypothetical protein